MGKQKHLSTDSLLSVVRLAEAGHVEPSIVSRILEAKKFSEVIDAFKSLYAPMDEVKVSKIWHHIVHGVWEGVLCDDDARTVFNEHDNIFVRELLRSGGVITKRECLSRVFKTEYYCNQTANAMVDMEIVFPVRLRNHGVLYVLDPKFFSEVFRGGR